MPWRNLILLISLFVASATKNDCETSFGREGPVVCCKHRHLRHVPQNLNVKVVKLFLDDNDLIKLNKTSLGLYVKLKELSMVKSRIVSIENDTFIGLTQLEVLDLSRNEFTVLSIFPDSLKKVYLDECPFLKLNDPLDGFFPKTLALISLNGNNIISYPQFLKNLTMLETIELSENNLREVTIDDLAPSCELRKLNVSNNAGGPIFLDESQKCQCSLTRQWTISYQIQLIGGKGTPACLASAQAPFECKVNISQKARDQHDQCKLVSQAIRRTQNQRKIVKIVIYASIAGGIVIFGTCLWLCCVRRRKKTIRRIQNRYDKDEEDEEKERYS